MSLTHLNDETILHFYNNIRRQVEAERHLPRKFMTGESVKQYAASLRDELTRRRLQHNPIDWHPDQ